MGITYEGICKKLGFDPKNYNPKVSNYENDTRVSPFSVLSIEESEFLYDYLKSN